MKIIFYLLILLLPTQLGRHFWPDFSFIQGLRVDYLSPTVYLTDILIILILTIWLISKLKTKNVKPHLKSKIFNLSFNYLLLMAFVVLVLIGIYYSTSPPAGFYGLVKLTEFLLLGFFIAKTVKSYKEVNNIAILFSIGIIFQSLLAVAQFVNQSSLNGIFWFLGERTFTSSTIGIANAVLDGQLVLRPYGTFPHPNVLAGFLVVAMTLILSKTPGGIIVSASVIIGTLGLLLTMSRAAIIIWLLVFSSWFIFNLKKNKLISILVVLVIIGSIGIIYQRLTGFSLTDESVIRRIELTQAAVEMIKTSPLFGVGINNFLVNLPDFQTTKNTILYLQPVHNIYLLIIAETGIVGLGIFLWFIRKTISKLLTTNNSLLTPLLIILVLGIFDHYFLTLQQGQLLLTLILGLCWSKIYQK